MENDDLPPLPLENVPKDPQQDDQYFSKKKYVRKDKFTLDDMLSDELGLPSIMSAFKN